MTLGGRSTTSTRGFLIIAFPATKFSEPVQQIQFYDRVLERVRALPGVESAGLIDDLPLNEEGSMQPVSIEGRPVVPMADMPEVSVRVISSATCARCAFHFSAAATSAIATRKVAPAEF